MPVMGLIFLRHAYSCYLSIKDEIVINLIKCDGKTCDRLLPRLMNGEIAL